MDGQFDRLLIPNRGAFDVIKVKSRHWPQWGGGGGGYPCYNDRRIIHMTFSSAVSISTVDILSRSLKVFSTNHNRFRETQGQPFFR